VIARWPTHQAAVATFVRGLAADAHVPLDPASRGGFAAGSCGFDEQLAFSSIAVPRLDAPTRVVITFSTGYPDGYATYAVTLDRGVPVAIHAFAA
jgi:hypothetical protein